MSRKAEKYLWAEYRARREAERLKSWRMICEVWRKVFPR
jgi:hypothetical protein